MRCKSGRNCCLFSQDSACAYGVRAAQATRRMYDACARDIKRGRKVLAISSKHEKEEGCCDPAVRVWELVQGACPAINELAIVIDLHAPSRVVRYTKARRYLRYLRYARRRSCKRCDPPRILCEALMLACADRIRMHQVRGYVGAPRAICWSQCLRSAGFYGCSLFSTMRRAYRHTRMGYCYGRTCVGHAQSARCDRDTCMPLARGKQRKRIATACGKCNMPRHAQKSTRMKARVRKAHTCALHNNRCFRVITPEAGKTRAYAAAATRCVRCTAHSGRC